MKRIVYSTLLFLLLSLSAMAQNGGINFQGMARNAAGEALANQKISLRLSVLLNSESGTVEYTETKEVTTSGQGIFSVVVGDGNILTKTGNFSDINWKNSLKFLKVELDPSGGTNFALMGTSRLQAVPFAYYANGVDAENVQGTLPVAKGGTGVASITALKTSLGIDQVSNTSDANKPLSTAAQTALNTKVDKVTGKELSSNDFTTAEKNKLAAITGTNTGDQDLSGLATIAALATKANTSDVTTSLALKANTTDLTAGLAGKVDKVTGKELSTNDFTTAEKTKLAAITGTNTGDQDLSGYATTAALAAKANTSDVTTSLAGKVDKVTGKELTSNDYTTAEKNKLAAISGTNTGDQDLSGYATTTALDTKANASDVTTGLAGKVDKVTGKELSSNDFTTAEKTKLAAISGTNTGDQDLSGYIQNLQNSTQAASININGSIIAGNIQNTPIGNGTPNLGTFTTLTTTGDGEIGGDLTVTGAASFATAPVLSSLTGNQALFTDSNKQIISNTTTGTGNVVMSHSPTLTGTLTMENLASTNDMVVNGLKLGRGAGNNPKNSVFGVDALISNTSGEGNVAIGFEALKNNTGGMNNVAFGVRSLTRNTDGNNNFAVGFETLPFNTTGTHNLAVGFQSLYSNTTGSNNFAVGYKSLFSNTTGGNNIALGNSSLLNNNNGSNNFAAGQLSLARNTDGVNNIAIGSETLPFNTSGNNNLALGYQSLFLNTTGGNNLALGYQSLYTNTTGGNNLALGYQSLYTNTTGGNNIALGNSSLLYNNTGSNNFAAGQLSLTRNTDGVNNIAIGYETLPFNTSGNNNLALGYQSLFSNTTGGNNLALGYQSLYTNTTGGNNVALGNSSLLYNNTGSNNFAAGQLSLARNTNGANNIAIGYETLPFNTSGTNNLALGYQSLFSNNSGLRNLALGLQSLFTNTIGSDNIGIGFGTLYNSTGNNNISIGSYSGLVLTTGSNNIIIGYGAEPSNATISNQITLGNSSITTLRAQVTSITSLSDRRDKTNIVPIAEGLDFIKQLKPVTFTWNTRDQAKVGIKSAGFIAQDLLALQKASPIGENLDLVSENNPEKLEARYNNLLPILVKAIQDQQQVIEDQKIRLDALEKLVQQLIQANEEGSVVASASAKK